jgi:hypothetical protein
VYEEREEEGEGEELGGERRGRREGEGRRGCKKRGRG